MRQYRIQDGELLRISTAYAVNSSIDGLDRSVNETESIEVSQWLVMLFLSLADEVGPHIDCPLHDTYHFASLMA
jgi:hypothetical protein